MFMQINLSQKGCAQTKVREPLVERPREKREMPDWLKVLLVRNSCYSINFGKAAEDAGMRARFPEMHCNWEMEEWLALGGRPNKREIIGEASDEQILDWLKKGIIGIRHNKWGRKSVRKHAVIGLVNALGKERDIGTDDFNNNGLRSLLAGYYRGSPYEALKDAGCDVKPWEMAKAPFGTYDDKEARVEAVKWLVEKLGKSPRDITTVDFYDNGLRTLLNKRYNGSPYEVLKDAGMVTEADEEYMRSSHHMHKGRVNGKPETEMPSTPSEGVEN